MKWIEITNTEPMGMPRPRAVRAGRGVRLYMPKEARKHLEAFKHQAALEWDGPPLEGPIHLDISVYHQAPKSRKAKRWRTTKPDIDNVLKMVMDALTGIVYLDDKQVVRVHIMQTEWDEKDNQELGPGYTIEVGKCP